MPPFFRILLACLAITGAGLTIRALWTGVVYGRNRTHYSRDAQPGMFAFLTFGNLAGIAICLWMAAGLYAGRFSRAVRPQRSLSLATLG
jgi:hypothetical protein